MAKHNDGSNWLSISVAVVTVGLFLGWLATREAPQAAVVSEPGDTLAAGTDSVVALNVSATQRADAFNDMVGQTVRMGSVKAVSSLNPRMFWIELAGSEPYLVKMGDALLAAGRTAPAPGLIDLTGVVQAKDAAVLDRWMADGILESAEERLLAEFGQTYLEAQQVQAAGAGN